MCRLVQECSSNAMITFQECIHPPLTHYCEEVYLVPLSCDLILLGASLLQHPCYCILSMSDVVSTECAVVEIRSSFLLFVCVAISRYRSQRVCCSGRLWADIVMTMLLTIVKREQSKDLSLWEQTNHRQKVLKPQRGMR